MTEYDTWLKVQEQKDRQRKPKYNLDYRKVNIRQVTYGMIIIVGAIATHLLSSKDDFDKLVGSIVLMGLLGLTMYYHFIVIYKETKEEVK